MDEGQSIWDVIIVGAGPAGSLAAILLAREGLAVLLIDRQPFGRDKVCGGCLHPHALHILERHRLLPAVQALGPVPLTEFELACRGRAVTLGLPAGLAVSRRALDQALVRQAVSAGAVCRDGLEARLLPAESDLRPVELVGEQDQVAAARLVVAADGLGGRLLARTGEVQVRRATRSRVGLGAVVADDGVPRGRVRMAVGRAGYVGLTRLEDGRLNVAAALDPAAAKDRGEAIAAVLREAGMPLPLGLADAEWRGTPPLTQRATRAGAERCLLVGDALGYVEPFTGEGMAWAFAAAEAVVPFALAAVREWRPELLDGWSRSTRERLGLRRWNCGLIAGWLRQPALVGAAIDLLRVWPSLSRPGMRVAYGEERR